MPQDQPIDRVAKHAHAALRDEPDDGMDTIGAGELARELVADPRLAMPQGEQRGGGERRLWPARSRRGVAEYTAQLESRACDSLLAVDQLVRLEHFDELLGEPKLPLEPVVARATHVRKRALDLSSQETSQDHVSVVAELTGVDVALVGYEVESPGEPTSNNFLVQPVDEPADRGHPGACYRTARDCVRAD